MSYPNIKKARHVIVPDLHTTNYQAGHQQVNCSSSTITAEVIFEVKTYCANNTNYSHSNTIPPSARQSRKVSLVYAQIFKKVDRMFVPEIVAGDNDQVVRSFEMA